MDSHYAPVKTKPAGPAHFHRLKDFAAYVPWFIISIGLLQTLLYYWGSEEVFQLLMYYPDHHQQPWRYVSYMFLHNGEIHLLMNLAVQTIIAVPLEAEQGALRTACVYLLGGLAGSLGTEVLDPKTTMVGASAGVYALLLAQIPNILYNYDVLRYKWYRALSVVCLCTGDIAYGFVSQGGPVISWSAHISGAAAGWLLGFIFFTSYDILTYTMTLLRYLSTILFLILFVFSILYIKTHKNKSIQY